MEDRKIIELLFARAESALEALSAKFGRRLMAIAMNILGIHQDAEEAVNDTYLAVWNAVPPKRPDPLSGYVYSTGRNISLDKLKYNTAQKRDGRYDESIEELANYIPARALDETVDARELGREINKFLGTLSAENRALFLRRYWFGDGVRDIAHSLGLRPNTAASRLARMRAQLKTFLVKEGYADE